MRWCAEGVGALVRGGGGGSPGIHSTSMSGRGRPIKNMYLKVAMVRKGGFHINELALGITKTPHTIESIGDVVDCYVLKGDLKKHAHRVHRINITLKY